MRMGRRASRGRKGPRGPKGDPGTGLDILGQYDSLDELQAAVTEPEIGDNYYVGAAAPYSIYTWTDVGGTAQWLDGGQLQGAKGDAGGYYVPSVDGSGNLSWSASEEGMPAVQGANIRGDQGETGAAGAPGEDGATFTPSVDGSGNLSWTNDKGLPNPTAVNITGPQGAAGEQGAPGADGGYYTPRRGQCGQPYMERQQVRYGRRKPGQYYGAGRCGWSAGYRRCAGRGRRVLRSDRERSDGRFELEREPGRNAERTRGQHTRAAGTGRRSGAGRRGRDHKRRQRAHATGGQQRGAGPIRRYADDKRQAVRVRQRDRFGRKPERGQDK